MIRFTYLYPILCFSVSPCSHKRANFIMEYIVIEMYNAMLIVLFSLFQSSMEYELRKNPTKVIKYNKYTSSSVVYTVSVYVFTKLCNNYIRTCMYQVNDRISLFYSAIAFQKRKRSSYIYSDLRGRYKKFMHAWVYGFVFFLNYVF